MDFLLPTSVNVLLSNLNLPTVSVLTTVHFYNIHNRKYCLLYTQGARSFVIAAQSLWNKLPADIRNATTYNEFKKMTKTFFLMKNFNSFFYSILFNLIF